jgi:hypothetical protein
MITDCSVMSIISSMLSLRVLSFLRPVSINITQHLPRQSKTSCDDDDESLTFLYFAPESGVRIADPHRRYFLKSSAIVGMREGGSESWFSQRVFHCPSQRKWMTGTHKSGITCLLGEQGRAGLAKYVIQLEVELCSGGHPHLCLPIKCPVAAIQVSRTDVSSIHSVLRDLMAPPQCAPFPTGRW